MTFRTYASLDWTEIYSNFINSGLSQRAFTKYKLPEMLPQGSSVPTLTTVIRHFQIIKNRRILLKNTEKEKLTEEKVKAEKAKEVE